MQRPFVYGEMNKPFIISEIGLNANGNVELAKKLIDMAVSCGADAVKFQKRDIDTVYTKEFLKEKRESPFGTTQGDQKRGLEFGKAEYDIIDAYCKEKGIVWFASAWDMKSLEFLKQYNLPYNKIASAMLTHRELVSSIAGHGKHTFISTGMSSWEQIDWAVNCFKRSGTPFTLLHCISIYPCADELCNIRVMLELKKRYNCEVGYSGHEVGLTPSLLAVAMGASAIERHITLDRAMYGSDQSASLEKHGLELLVREARLIQSMMGSGEREILPKEIECANKLRYWQQGVYA